MFFSVLFYARFLGSKNPDEEIKSLDSKNLQSYEEEEEKLVKLTNLMIKGLERLFE